MNSREVNFEIRIIFITYFAIVLEISLSQFFTKLGIRDKNIWTELILEASGASDTIGTVLNLFDTAAETGEQKLLQVFDFRKFYVASY